MSEDDSTLSGSEQFMLISGGMAAAGACLAMVLQFVLKSRCSRIQMCGMECDRQVIDISASDTDITASNRA